VIVAGVLRKVIFSRNRTKAFHVNRDLCAGMEFCWAEWLGASGIIGQAVWDGGALKIAG
jgi:hypothetical protein